MKCEICGKTVTKSQVRHAEAIKIDGKHFHTDCLDHAYREDGDAYKK
jgi:hypothetical protein